MAPGVFLSGLQGGGTADHKGDKKQADVPHGKIESWAKECIRRRAGFEIVTMG